MIIEYIVHVPLQFTLANKRAMVKQMCLQIIATFNIRKKILIQRVFLTLHLAKLVLGKLHAGDNNKDFNLTQFQSLHFLRNEQGYEFEWEPLCRMWPKA